MAEQNVQQPKKKKGGKWIAPAIIFGLLAFAIVAPIATLYICFYDGTAKDIEKDESFNASTFLNDKMVAALDTTKDDGQVAIKVSENEINQALLATKDAVVGAIPTVGKFVNGADVIAGDTQYVFSLNGHFYKLFKTRARVFASLGEETIDGEDCLVFKLNDVKVGRVSFLKTYKRNKLLQKLINDDIVNSFLGGTGFSLKSDINNNDRIYYPKSAIADDITIFDEEGGEGSIYTTLLSEFFHQNMFKINFNKEGFQGGIDLTKAHYNDTFVSLEKNNDVNFLALRDKVQDLLNAGVPKEDAELLYKFFIVGFAKLSEEEQNEMLGFDLSEYGIPDVSTHQGVIIDYTDEPAPGKIKRPQVTLQNYVSSQADMSECDPGDDIAIVEESELNKTLMSSDAIGTPKVLIHTLNDGSYKVNTFSINNMYCNIYNNSVKFAVDLSVNGYDTYICLDTSLSSSNTFVMNFNIDNIYYGEMNSSDAFKDQLLNLLFDSFGTGGTVAFDQENRKFVVDVTSSVTSAKKDKIEAAGGVDQIVTGTSKADDGTLIFRVHNG